MNVTIPFTHEEWQHIHLHSKRDHVKHSEITSKLPCYLKLRKEDERKFLLSYLHSQTTNTKVDHLNFDNYHNHTSKQNQTQTQ